MPFPLLAHQAPLLPLITRRSRWWNGLALVIGSMTPDLDYLWTRVPGATELGHSPAGQFLVCLPVTLAVVYVVAWFRIGETLAARMGDRWAWLATPSLDPFSRRGLLRAAVSALVGSLSHLLLDALTHRWLPPLVPVGEFLFHGIRITATTICQLAATSVGATIAVVWLARKWRGFARPPALLQRRKGGLFLVAAALLGAGLGTLRALPALRRPTLYFFAAPIFAWGYAAFSAAVGMGLFGLLAAIALAVIDRRSMAIAERS